MPNAGEKIIAFYFLRAHVLPSGIRVSERCFSLMSNQVEVPCVAFSLKYLIVGTQFLNEISFKRITKCIFSIDEVTLINTLLLETSYERKIALY